MSSPGKPDLKGGHAPAVKVGGMRIPGKVHPEKATKEPDVEDEEYEETSGKSPPANETRVLISGAPSHGNKDFPPEAIKQFHEKPMPTHQKNVSTKPIKVVQQPRKN
ncbi:death-associated protein 1-like [Lytechinus variegatus]|uniref:death-associated protein 1-like n=1 Tax=Lytechinus variegatus TaxID=7654 RepID=UPI001BB1FEB5|nr:death-associated protein 1-like [Lytechinus variegatus]